MRWPLENFTITQGFTPTHQGNDLYAPLGTEILAPEGGRISQINNDTGYYGGKFIKLRGNSGNEYYMGHDSSVLVSQGQRVEEGELIGKVGMTGQATGPHIHFQIWVNGQLVDPSNVIKETGEDMGRIQELEQQVKDLEARVDLAVSQATGANNRADGLEEELKNERKGYEGKISELEKALGSAGEAPGKLEKIKEILK